MRKRMVAGNWKMNGSREQTARLLEALVAGLDPQAASDVLVCPPFVYLAEAARLLSDSGIALGAQSLCAEDGGAFTGEIAGAMLADVGCMHVIVGHSERRSLYGESDSLVARKFMAAQKHGLTPILCVGETLEEREQGVTAEVVSRQLGAVLDACGVQAFAEAIVAYEPVWAIGTGRSASSEQAQEVHAQIRADIAAKDVKIANSLKILYGGSVKASNAAELFAMADIDGGLVGGASLDAEEFLKICHCA